MNDVPNFDGKVLAICIIDDECHHDLISPRLEMQAGRLFLVGISTGKATFSGWTDGCRTAVAWDRVTEYHVFDSVEHYKSAIGKSEALDADEDS